MRFVDGTKPGELMKAAFELEAGEVFVTHLSRIDVGQGDTDLYQVSRLGLAVICDCYDEAIAMELGRLIEEHGEIGPLAAPAGSLA